MTDKSVLYELRDILDNELKYQFRPVNAALRLETLIKQLERKERKNAK